MRTAPPLRSHLYLLFGLILFLQSFSRWSEARDPADAATAQALYDQARDLMQKGRYTPACKKLEESQRLDPGVGTKFWLAECYEKSHRLASAWVLYLDVATLAASAGHESREQVARERAAAVLLRMPRLTIEFEGELPPGLVLKRNGRLVGEAQFGAPLPVDEGEHLLEVSAPGYELLTLRIDIGVHDTEKRIIIPELTEAHQTENSVVHVPRKEPETPSGWQRMGAWQKVGLMSAGAGVLVAGAGGILGLVALGKANRAPCNEDNLCTGKGVSMRRTALAMGETATLLAVSGGAVAIAGMSLYFLAPKKGSAKLALSPTPGGLQLRGSW